MLVVEQVLQAFVARHLMALLMCLEDTGVVVADRHEFEMVGMRSNGAEMVLANTATTDNGDSDSSILDGFAHGQLTLS